MEVVEDGMAAQGREVAPERSRRRAANGRVEVEELRPAVRTGLEGELDLAGLDPPRVDVSPLDERVDRQERMRSFSSVVAMGPRKSSYSSRRSAVCSGRPSDRAPASGRGRASPGDAGHPRRGLRSPVRPRAARQRRRARRGARRAPRRRASPRSCRGWRGPLPAPVPMWQLRPVLLAHRATIRVRPVVEIPVVHSDRR